MLKEFSWKTLVAITVAPWIVCASALAQDNTGGVFEGKVVLKPVGDDPFVPSFRLQETLLFRQGGGMEWISPEGAIVDGRSVPTLFVQLTGQPFESSFRKSAVTYDHAVKRKHREWELVLRMFYDALRTEGVEEAEAKSMYLVLSGSGTRWVLRDEKNCFGRCHADARELEWRPRVDDERLLSLVPWVQAENPDLDQIDQRARATIIEAGPHIFGVMD